LFKLFGVGKSKENLEISLDKTEYQAGETVRGTLVIAVDDNDIKARSLRFIAEGKEETNFTKTETETSYDENGNSTTSEKDVTYSDSNIFFSTNLAHFLLKGNNPSLITNTDNNIIIHQGSSEISFEFLLPENAISSYNGRAASITYEVKATIDKKLRSDTNTSLNFDVISTINEKNNYSTNSSIYSTSNNNTGLYLKLVLTKNIYNKGDTIDGIIIIENPKLNSTSTTMRNIKIKLIGTEYATASGKSETTMIYTYDSEIVNCKENEETPFEIKIPEDVNKSYRSKLSEIYWEIKAIVDISSEKDIAVVSRIDIL
jgi:hypothetical protein